MLPKQRLSVLHDIDVDSDALKLSKSRRWFSTHPPGRLATQYEP